MSHPHPLLSGRRHCFLYCPSQTLYILAQWVRWLDYLTTRTRLSPIRRGFAPSFVNYKKGCSRLAAASDQVYQMLAHGRWFSPGTPVSSTTKIGHHDIAEILLKVALKHQKSKLNITIWRIVYHDSSLISSLDPKGRVRYCSRQ